MQVIAFFKNPDIVFLMTVQEIARDVRRQFELRHVDRGILQQLYRPYADVPDLVAFVMVAEKLFPKRCCGLASLYLQHVLGQGAIVQGQYRGHEHTFLQLDDGSIVDITSDQYGGPSVYCGPLSAPYVLTQ